MFCPYLCIHNTNNSDSVGLWQLSECCVMDCCVYRCDSCQSAVQFFGKTIDQLCAFYKANNFFVPGDL